MVRQVLGSRARPARPGGVAKPRTILRFFSYLTRRKSSRACHSARVAQLLSQLLLRLQLLEGTNNIQKQVPNCRMSSNSMEHL